MKRLALDELTIDPKYFPTPLLLDDTFFNKELRDVVPRLTESLKQVLIGCPFIGMQHVRVSLETYHTGDNYPSGENKALTHVDGNAYVHFIGFGHTMPSIQENPLPEGQWCSFWHAYPLEYPKPKLKERVCYLKVIESNFTEDSSLEEIEAFRKTVEEFLDNESRANKQGN